jgi:hypothetical protein
MIIIRDKLILLITCAIGCWSILPFFNQFNSLLFSIISLIFSIIIGCLVIMYSNFKFRDLIIFSSVYIILIIANNLGFQKEIELLSLVMMVFITIICIFIFMKFDIRFNHQGAEKSLCKNESLWNVLIFIAAYASLTVFLWEKRRGFEHLFYATASSVVVGGAMLVVILVKLNQIHRRI